MFDEPPSLPMRAAVASLLGGLFGVGLILATHSVQAQGPARAGEVLAQDPSTALVRRAGDPALRPAHVAEAAFGGSGNGSRGLRFNDSGSDAGSGLRWQLARVKGLRSEGEIPRSRDLISVGVQVRY